MKVINLIFLFLVFYIKLDFAHSQTFAGADGPPNPAYCQRTCAGCYNIPVLERQGVIPSRCFEFNEPVFNREMGESYTVGPCCDPTAIKSVSGAPRCVEIDENRIQCTRGSVRRNYTRRNPVNINNSERGVSPEDDNKEGRTTPQGGSSAANRR